MLNTFPMKTSFETRIVIENIHNNSRVFPLPNLPQIRESLPSGNLIVRSARTNLCLGVDATEDALLPIWERSCGQVIVADCIAIFCDWSEMGGTEVTSAPCRYFSIRRRETRLWGWKMTREHFWAYKKSTYLQHIDQSLRKSVQSELHFWENCEATRLIGCLAYFKFWHVPVI